MCIRETQTKLSTTSPRSGRRAADQIIEKKNEPRFDGKIDRMKVLELRRERSECGRARETHAVAWSE